jgi:hypothetical protein
LTYALPASAFDTVDGATLHALATSLIVTRLLGSCDALVVRLASGEAVRLGTLFIVLLASWISGPTRHLDIRQKRRLDCNRFRKSFL